jgi:hypothetical protein
MKSKRWARTALRAAAIDPYNVGQHALNSKKEICFSCTPEVQGKPNHELVDPGFGIV